MLREEEEAKKPRAEQKAKEKTKADQAVRGPSRFIFLLRVSVPTRARRRAERRAGDEGREARQRRRPQPPRGVKSNLQRERGAKSLACSAPATF